LILLEICIFVPRFYQIFETGLSAQSHKQRGHHASAISGYTFAEQKVSKQQLVKVSLPWLLLLLLVFCCSQQQVSDSHHLASGSRRRRTAATAARHP